jgi:hypothetical protein
MATRRVDAPAEAAFAYLADPLALGRWSLGCFATSAADGTDLYEGRSLIDGRRVWFRIDADARRLTVDYLVGTPDRLARRISARVKPGEEVGMPEGTCLVSLCAWRTAGMDDERWRDVCALHETEIILIAGQIAAEAKRAGP